jgi:ribonuclease M5
VAERIRLDHPVVVEGKYDKIRLSSVLDADILTTDGFRVFKDKEKAAMLRRIAAQNGIIVLTDSDGGGLVIRNYFNAILPKDKVIHLYIPAVKGREKRKTEDSKEGLLGVEGMDNELLRQLFEPFAADTDAPPKGEPITKADLYADGLSGGVGSREKRIALCRLAGLPLNLSADAMLTALNLL